MNDRIHDSAKPNEDFSSPAFHREAVACSIAMRRLPLGHIRKDRFIRALTRVPGYSFWSEDPLTDDYIPLAIVHMRAGKGKIAVVFPKFTDESDDDGTVTDRSVTIHFMGDVGAADMIVACGNLLRAMPMPLPARATDPGNEIEPCSKSGL